MITDPILLSLLLRVLGVVLSVFLLYRVRDRRFVFLVVMLSLMALRQALTLFGMVPNLQELPGFLVSILAVGLVFYLLQYVRQEKETKDRLREANERLRLHRNRLQATMAASPDYTFLFDEDGRYREILSGEDDITLHSPAQFIDSTVEEMLPEETAPHVREAIEETLRTGRSQRIEYPIPREENVEWYEGRTADLRYPGDGSRRVLFIARDVTERKARETELRRFRQAIETAGHAIYITDRSGEITYVNPAFEDITGYSREEAVGRTPNILNSGTMSDDYFADLWETILKGAVWEGELLNERRDGTPYYAHQTIAPVTDESGTIREFVAVQTDITPVKERERQLKVLSRVLRHNLRNDMNVILGRARLIESKVEENGSGQRDGDGNEQKDGDGSGNVAADAAQIEKTGEQLLELAETYREILTLIESANAPRPMTLLDDLRAEVRKLREARPAVTLHVEFDCPDDTVVYAVPGYERAVGELLENAVVHSDRESPEIHLRVTSTDERVRIRVADDGPGIPPSEWQMLTGDHEIDSVSHGTGLELWLVYWIVTRSDGTLDFDANEPRGSVVTIELQRAAG